MTGSLLDSQKQILIRTKREMSSAGVRIRGMGATMQVNAGDH